MESQTLYRVKKEDLPKLEKLLVKCLPMTLYTAS